jgi:integrase
MKLIACTLLRTAELITLRWADVDRDAATITVPGERMKVGETTWCHSLNKLCTHCAYLRQISGSIRVGYVFPGYTRSSHDEQHDIASDVQAYGIQRENDRSRLA